MYRYVIPEKEFVDVYNRYKRHNFAMVVGASSFFVRKEGIKFVNRASCKQVNGEWLLAGEYARQVIKKYVGEDIDIPHNIHLQGKLSPPTMFIGQYSGIGVYLDLTGAYWQIYKRLWYDMTYPRGRGTIPLAPIAKELAWWKAARNAVVGISIARKIAVRIGDNLHLQYTSGELKNFAVWHTIQVILNNIAEFMHYKLGAFYVATDGYFLPAKSLNRAKEFL